MNKNMILLIFVVLLFSGCIEQLKDNDIINTTTNNTTNIESNLSKPTFYMANGTLEKLKNNTLIFTASQPQPVSKVIKEGTNYSHSKIIINKTYVKSIEYQNDEIIITIDKK